MNRTASSLKVFALTMALLSLLALSVGVAYGQAISGNMVGTVVDSTGAAVAGADMTATNVATGGTASAKTNSTGQYRFGNLLVGNYKITAKASGFRTTTVLVEVLLNTTGTANVTLVPGATSETVEVSGEAPIIDTTTPQLETTYQEKQLLDLPTTGLGVSPNGQNLGVLNLALLDAGVGSSGGLGAGTGPSVGGQRPRNNNFTVEGVDNNDKGVTGPLIYVPQDAVSNFSVLQNQFSSEFGHSTGGQFNIVVQSGTNSFHGRAYEYFQNRNLNAVDQSLANQGIFHNPRYDSNRYGGQLGGPIFKNKLFFFVNFERNSIGEAFTPGSPLLAPTAAGYAAAEAAVTAAGESTANLLALKNFIVAPSACTASQIAQSVCPAANPATGQLGGNVLVAGTNAQVGVFPLTAAAFTNYPALVTSMDYNLSEKDQIRGRYIYNKNTSTDAGLIGVTLPIFYTTVPIPFHLVNLAEYHTFSPTISNELRVGFNRTGFNFTTPNLSFLPTLHGFPNLTFDDLGGTNIGPDPNAPQSSTQNLYQAVDNLTVIKGNHTLKFGVEGRKAISPQKFIQRSRGDYEYKTFDAFAQDLIPDGAVNERSFGNVGYSGDNWGLFWFVNDTWKIRPSLSLTLGLRYEFLGIPFGWTQQSLNSIANVPGLIEFAAPVAPKKDFMPRVGFAYSPGTSGNTSIRGGFGMGYDVLYDNIGVLSRPPQIGNTVDCPATCAATGFLAGQPGAPGGGGIPFQNVTGINVLDQAAARANTSSFLPKNVKYPKALSWNLGVQRTFKSNYTAEVRYVGTRGEALNVQNRINVINVATPGHSLPTFFTPPSQATLDALTLTRGQLRSEFNAGGYLDPAYLLPNTICGGTGLGLVGNCGFFSEIVGFVPWGSSTYHGLQTQLNRRFANGLQLQAAYTFSHNIDNSTADFFSTIVAPRRPQTFRDLPAERANSVLDHRHRITLQAVYEMPWYKHSSSWLMRNVVGNYEIAPVYTWESGQWGTLQSGTDSNLNTDGAADRVLINPNGVGSTGSGVTPLCNSSLPSTSTCGDAASRPFWVAYGANDPTAKYVVAGQGSLPGSSRNTFTTAPINNFDVTLVKHFAFTERYRFDLMMGLLNALNHPQFVTGSINQANSLSVTGQGQRNYFIPGSPNFGDSRASWPSNARTMQLAVKFSF